MFVPKCWNLGVESIFEKLNSNVDGLSSEEAGKRIDTYGKNEYKKPKKETLVSKILSQFKDISMIILFIAGLISFAMAWNNGDGFIEPIIIFGIMTMNTFLTIYQEKNAEKVLDELSNMNIPNCVVLRDNCRRVVRKDEIVPGDVVELKTGDFIPADARIVNCTNFEVDESALTGESEPVEKSCDVVLEENTPVAERKNMVFSSCPSLLFISETYTNPITRTDSTTISAAVRIFFLEFIKNPFFLSQKSDIME